MAKMGKLTASRVRDEINQNHLRTRRENKLSNRFKIDTGADVTVIREADYLRSGLPQIRSLSKTLFGPCQEKLIHQRSCQRCIENLKFERNTARYLSYWKS
jgi:hypothetical protein